MTAATYSVDEVARTSDESAVRARFDAACLTALRIESIIFLIAGFAHLTGARTPMAVVAGAASFVLGALTLLAVRKSATYRLSSFVRRRARAVAIVFMVVQSALLLAFHSRPDDAETVGGVSALLALLALWYRLLPAEHVLLHGSISGLTVAASLGSARDLFPPLIVHAMALMGSLFISRGMRRNVVAEWSQRRENAREQIRMRDELRYARELQLSMLPERAPDIAWAEISSLSIPATEVGGDYFDYFVAGDRVVLVCGDVAGHGMAAGLVLATLRAGFSLMRELLHDPAVVLGRLHELISETTRRRMLVTVSVVLLDRAAMRATVASAGHPPVLVRHRDGRVEAIELFAPPLGVRLPLQIPQRQLPLTAGDVFVLHSDGVYETRNTDDETYGLDRLQRIVAEHTEATAQELRDAILGDLTMFRGAAEPQDDVTLVVCRLVL